MLWFASITWSILWKFYSQNMSNIFKRLNMNKSGHLPQDRCDDKMVCVCRRITVRPFSVVDWYYASRLIGLEHNLTVYLICILYTLVIDYLVERGSTAHTRRSIIGYFFFLSLYWHNCLNERSRTNDTRANRSTSERRLPSHSAVLCRRTSFLPLSFSLSLNSSSLLRSIPFFPYPPHRLIPPTSIPVSSILSLKISSFFSSPTYCCCDCTSWTTWLACFLLVVFAVVFSPIFTRSIENLSRRCRQQPTEHEFTFTNSVHWVIASSWESRLWLWKWLIGGCVSEVATAILKWLLVKYATGDDNTRGRWRAWQSITRSCEYVVLFSEVWRLDTTLYYDDDTISQPV